MKTTAFLLAILLLTLNCVYATGKIYWQPNGVLLTTVNGAGVVGMIADIRGGAITFSGDLDSIYAIKINRNGQLPWGIQGRVVDNKSYGSFQAYPRGVSDGKGGAIIIWDRFFPWGHNLFYQKMDSSGNKVWGTEGVAVTVSDSSQENHVIAGDGTGGAIVAWQQYRSGQYDIYAQRLDSNGAICWGDTGVAVCTANDLQDSPVITVDDNGNSVIAWEDQRNGQYDIFAQRLDINGNRKWMTNGIAVCDTDNHQSLSGYQTNMTQSLDGSVIITWSDKRSGMWDVYAQRIDSNGFPLWGQQGVPVCDTINSQGGGPSISDGNGGAILCWFDERNGYRNIYAQRVSFNGLLLWQHEGSQVCAADSVDWYQRMATDGGSGAIICWQDRRAGNTDIYAQHIDSLGNIKWGINGIALCTASGRQEWPEIIPADSGTAIACWCDQRSGHWQGYAQRIGDDPNGVGSDNYKLSVEYFRLMQNNPNPFKQTTKINYQLNTMAPVKLNIYNITGQWVRTLVDEVKKAGFNSVAWDGKDDKGNRVCAGIYFYRLSFNGGSLTKKLTLIK